MLKSVTIVSHFNSGTISESELSVRVRNLCARIRQKGIDQPVLACSQSGAATTFAMKMGRHLRSQPECWHDLDILAHELDHNELSAQAENIVRRISIFETQLVKRQAPGHLVIVTDDCLISLLVAEVASGFNCRHQCRGLDLQQGHAVGFLKDPFEIFLFKGAKKKVLTLATV